jgi:hypothetical protein
LEARRSILGIRADWKAIVFCLLSASVFWFFNVMNEDHTSDISYPVEFEFDENKRIPVEALPKRIKFNASGFGWNLLRKIIKVNRPPLRIDLDELSSYKYLTATDLLPIIKAQLHDVKINYLLQDTLFFRFDRVITRKFPVRIDPASISLLEGYKISSPVIIEPGKITLIGPSSIVSAIKDSFFIKIEERKIQTDFDENISPEFEVPELVRYEPAEYKVKFSVTQFEEEEFSLEPAVKNFPDGVKPDLDDNKVSLKVLIRPEDIDKLKNEDFTVVINYRRLDEATGTVPVKLLQKPPYVVDYTLQPSEVKVKR